MFDFIKAMFRPKPKRLELRLVPWGEQADALLAAGWQIAKEEDTNRRAFQVYLERLEP